MALTASLSSEHQAHLLNLARETINYGCKHHMMPLHDIPKDEPCLYRDQACFVTLHKNEQLRGCIGSLYATRPLFSDVQHNAYASAFNDHRFNAVTPNELGNINIEISLLSTPTELYAPDESALLHQLERNKTGVILSYKQHRATFLPQVWQQLPNPTQFVAQLKRKAGLDELFWSKHMHCYSYTCEAFTEGAKGSKAVVFKP